MSLASIVGSIGSIGGDLFGKVVDYDIARRLQHDSQDFQDRFYGRRHQYEVRDLMAAGLNPVLSAKFGGGTASGGIANVSSIGNPMINSAQLAKTNAEKKLTEQLGSESSAREAEADARTEESEARKKMIDVQAASAGYQKELDYMDLQRKRKEYGLIDLDDVSGNVVPIVESMTPSMRGPMRLGIHGASRLKMVVKALDKFFRKNIMDVRVPKKRNKGVEKDVKSAVKKLRSGKFRPVKTKDGGVQFKVRR